MQEWSTISNTSPGALLTRIAEAVGSFQLLLLTCKEKNKFNYTTGSCTQENTHNFKYIHKLLLIHFAYQVEVYPVEDSKSKTYLEMISLIYNGKKSFQND